MKAFAYVNAANEKEAVAALSPERGAVMPIAGGMDLLGLMKDYIAQPDRLVNVKNLDRTIRKTPDGGLRCRRRPKSARRKSAMPARWAAT